MLTPFFPSADNPVRGCFIAEVNGALARLGVRSTVIAASPLHYPRMHATPSAPCRWVRFPQIPGNLGLASAGRFLYARLRAGVTRLHQQDPIDVIHAHAALPCGHAAALLSRRLRIPFVITLHGLDVFNSCFAGGVPAAWRKRVSIDVYHAASNVICISQSVQRLLFAGRRDGIRSTVVYNGTDTELFTPASGETNPSKLEILMVGNLLAGKGHELVFRAMCALGEKFPGLRCRVIGDGADRGRFETMTRDLGIAERVQFDGVKSRIEVADAMRSCTVFALPSKYEGLGCAYLEAMASGKPVIACRGQGIEEIIEHGKNGWLVPKWSTPSDAEAELQKGLSVLLQSQNLRRLLGEAARRTIVERLTLAHQAEQLGQIYDEATA